VCYTQDNRFAEEEPPRIAIVGPTAAGKTAVGLALAQTLGTEIVSADSVQVYRGMDIGAAKPTPAEQERVRFHGVDVAAPDQEWTLADYQSLGESACQSLAAQGRPALVVGGTGLYVRALTTTLNIPQTPPDTAFRAQWQEAARAQGTAFVQAQLAQVDPEAAARIHVNDLGRLVRALEVFHATGVPLSEWHRRDREQTAKLNVRVFGIHYADRRLLYERIDARVHQMLADGLVDEVRALLTAGYGRSLKPMQSLGYRHMASFLAGEIGYTDAVDAMKRDTRHFARRQLIWFRADARTHWLDAGTLAPTQMADFIADALTQNNTEHKQGYAPA